MPLDPCDDGVANRLVYLWSTPLEFLHTPAGGGRTRKDGTRDVKMMLLSGNPIPFPENRGLLGELDELLWVGEVSSWLLPDYVCTNHCGSISTWPTSNGS